MNQLLEIIGRLCKHPCAAIFLKAVDPDVFPDYYTKIPHPIDLSLICDRVRKSRYTSLKSVVKDMRLIKDNTQKYFGERSYQSVLAVHLIRLFDKELEGCTNTSTGRWTRLYSAQVNRLLRKLSNFPQPLGDLSAVVGALSSARPVNLGEPLIEQEEVQRPPKEHNGSKEGRNGIANHEQDRFLEAVGSLGAREAKGFAEIVQHYYPNSGFGGVDLEIPVESLSGECWKKLIAYAQKRFRDLGWRYPV
jgi:hypothetical protein